MGICNSRIDDFINEIFDESFTPEFLLSSRIRNLGCKSFDEYVAYNNVHRTRDIFTNGVSSLNKVITLKYFVNDYMKICYKRYLLKHKNKKYLHCTEAKKLYIQRMLERNFIAYLIGDEYKYNEFTNSQYVINIIPLSKEKIDNFRISCCVENPEYVESKYLDINSSDPYIVNKIEINFIRKIIIGTLRFRKEMHGVLDRIYSYLTASTSR